MPDPQGLDQAGENGGGQDRGGTARAESPGSDPLVSGNECPRSPVLLNFSRET